MGDLSPEDNGKYIKIATTDDGDYKFEAANIPTTNIVEIPEATEEVTLSNNSDIRWLGNHSSIVLKLPAEKSLSSYKSRVAFKKVTTGLNTYGLTLPDDVTWHGDSIDSDTKKFKPDTDAQYTIDFWNDGFGVKANVIQW